MRKNQDRKNAIIKEMDLGEKAKGFLKKYWPALLAVGASFLIGIVILMLVFGVFGFAVSLFRWFGNTSLFSSGGIGVAAIPADYARVFTAAGAKWKVKPEFLAAIFYIEQGKKFPLPIPAAWATSPKGAQGPFQFMPATWENHKQDGNNDGKMDINNIWDTAFAAAQWFANMPPEAYMGGNNANLEQARNAASMYNSGKPWSQGQNLQETAKYVPNVINAFLTFLNVKQREYCSNIPELQKSYGATSQEVERQLVTVNFMGHNLRFHQKAAPALQAVVNEIKTSGANYQFRSLGTYKWRNNVNDPDELSVHSFGIAIDINPDSNPNRSDNKLITDLPSGVINAFKRNSFRWGGEYNRIKDPMHFEYCK